MIFEKLKKAEIEDLVKAADYEKLEKLLCSRMAFGTAGLRSRMGAGFRLGCTLDFLNFSKIVKKI